MHFIQQEERKNRERKKDNNDIHKRNGGFSRIVSLVTVISASSLLLQTQIILLFQIWQQHQSNRRALKDAVTVGNNARTRYRMMKLRFVFFLLVQKARRKNSYKRIGDT